MEITQSSLKTELQGFNNLPTRQEIAAMVMKHFRCAEFVDIDEEYWKNDYDTLVVAFDGDAIHKGKADNVLKAMDGMAGFIWASDCDEYHSKRIGTTMVCRFWWD